MALIHNDPQTAFGEETLTPEQAATFLKALEDREQKQDEAFHADGHVKLLAESLPDGIYRLGPWKVVIETQTKTKVRISKPKRG